MKLIKGAQRLFNWLQEQTAGAIVPRSTVLSVTEWKEVTLRTYINKNKLAPFLVEESTDKLRVVMNGTDITEEFFHERFTQKAPPSSAAPQ